ncbi:MAG: PAS domain S-box protein [Verrucomicrobiota bacterium]
MRPPVLFSLRGRLLLLIALALLPILSLLWYHVWQADHAMVSEIEIHVFNETQFALACMAAVVVPLLAVEFLVIRQIKRLVAATRKLTAGCLDARVGRHGSSGELVELSQSIDLLAAALEKRQQERDQLLAQNEHDRRILQAMMDASLETLLLVNREGQVLFINKTGAQRVGRTADAMIGHNIREFLPPATGNLRCDWGQKVLETRQPVTFEDQRGDYWLEHHFCPVFDERETLFAVAAFTRDVTQRRQAEAAVRRSEERYRGLFDFGADGILLGAQDGTILDANTRICELSGYARAELVGMHITRLFPPEILRQTPLRFDLLLSGQTVIHERRLRRKNGGEVPVEMSSKMLPDGTLQSYYRDISERQRAEVELAHSREQMRALAARTTTVREEERTRIAREVHDNLGQLVTGIKMDVVWVANRLNFDQEELRRKMRDIADLADVTVEMVREISRELRPGVLDDLDLAAALEWQAKEFERRTGVVCDFNSSLREEVVWPELATTLFRIQQEALTNILRHANATHVEVTLSQEQGTVCMRVRDDGRGITASELNDKSALGLLSMHERAFALGGRVDISGTPGGGTVVVAEIPPPTSSSC